MVVGKASSEPLILQEVFRQSIWYDPSDDQRKIKNKGSKVLKQAASDPSNQIWEWPWLVNAYVLIKPNGAQTHYADDEWVYLCLCSMS